MTAPETRRTFLKGSNNRGERNGPIEVRTGRRVRRTALRRGGGGRVLHAGDTRRRHAGSTAGSDGRVGSNGPRGQRVHGRRRLPVLLRLRDGAIHAAASRRAGIRHLAARAGRWDARRGRHAGERGDAPRSRPCSRCRARPAGGALPVRARRDRGAHLRVRLSRVHNGCRGLGGGGPLTPSQSALGSSADCRGPSDRAARVVQRGSGGRRAVRAAADSRHPPAADLDARPRGRPRAPTGREARHPRKLAAHA